MFNFAFGERIDVNFNAKTQRFLDKNSFKNYERKGVSLSKGANL